MLIEKVKDMSNVFALTSIMFLIVLAISPAKDYFSEWRAFQHEYNRLIEEQPRRIKPVEIGIKQFWLPDLGVTDRCTSCHLGVAEINLIDMPAPFQTHPAMYHSTDEFGCTPCHQGQGIATTTIESVGHEEFWDDPMLPLEFAEAGCGTCHEDVFVAEAPVLSRGRDLIQELNCVSCHKILGYEPEYVVPLDGIGNKVNRNWIVKWLSSPHEVEATTKMPDFKLTDDEADLLADFLVSLDKNSVEMIQLPPELIEEWPDEDLVELGSTRFREARCISCHLINEKGGHLAPELGKIASKVKREWLFNFIKDPKALHPGIPMPKYGFSEKDAIAVTAYIVSEFRDWDAEEDSVQIEHTPKPDYFKKGMTLFNTYNCGGCHELNVPGVGKNMGPDLSAIGSIPQTQLEYGDSDIETTRPSYIYNKVKDPRIFLENSRMPIFDLKNDDLIAVTTALLAMRDSAIPEKYKAEYHTQTEYRPQGEFGKLVEKYSCFSCHVINDEGYLLASDLSNEGSRVQYKWMKNYFRLPYTLRPILTERMPNLFMSEEEIKFISDYLDLLFVNDDIDNIEISMDAESIIDGAHLLKEIYGCNSCHLIDGEGGYVGIPFDETSKRSTPQWVYTWIMNPQKYRPDLICPDQGLSEIEGKHITAYIMNLSKK